MSVVLYIESTPCKISMTPPKRMDSKDAKSKLDFVLKTFDTKKLMWGSDWPVLTIAENII